MPTINIRWADNTAQLRENLKQGVDQIEATKASAEKMAKALGGENLIRAAHNYVAAVQQVGGANKLTAEWQEKVNGTVSKAIAQYTAMGKTAPKAMLDLAAATKSTVAPTEQLSSAINSVGRDILTTAAGFLTAQAAISAAKGGITLIAHEIETLVIQGSAVSDVTANFERLTSQTGRLGSTLLSSLREGTHRTIDDFSLMKLATQDLAAGLKLTDQQFGVMAKGAFALAQATGTDVKTALDTMNDAMLTGRTRALAMLTGKIDLTAAEEKFAKSIGSTADHLNEEGKLEAARAAILDGVSAATERLGEQVDGLDEHVAQAQAAWENFHNELARTVAESPVLEAGFQAIEEAIAGALGSNQEERVKNVTAAIEQIAIKIPDVIDFIVSLGVSAARVFDDIERRAGGVGNAIKHIGVGASAGAAMGMFAGGVGAVPGALIGSAVGAFMPTGSSSGGGPSEAMLAVEAAAKKSGEATALMRQRMIEAHDTAAAFVGPLQDTAAAHTAAAAAADKHGQFTQRTKEEISKEAAELKKAAAITAEAASSMNDLSGAQVEAIRYYKDQQVSVSDTAKILGIYEQQVRQVITAEADALKASKALADFRKRVAKEQAESLTEMSGEVLSNLKVQTAAEKEHWTAVAKLTMTGVQFDLAQVDQWEVEEKAKLDQRALNHKAAEDAIVQAAQDRRDEIRRLAEFEDVKIKYEFVGPVSGGPASGPTAGQQFQHSLVGVLKNVPRTIADAFQNGGDLLGAAKSIGSQFGAALGKHIGDGIKALGALGGPIGEALGSFIGPLVDKLFSIGGPSKEELAGRSIVQSFESQFSSVEDMINKVGDAYRANGKTAEQAQAAIQRLWAAEKLGADATKRALQEINEELKRQGEIADAIHGEGFQSQDEIRHAADIANAAYEEMLRSGQYTADQVDKAYRHYQELLAQLEGAAGEAARAWLKAHQSADDAAKASTDAMKSAEADLKTLVDKRNALAQGIAAEAPEQVMGVIEAQQRGQLAALDKEIQDKADAYAKLADETGQKMADAIVEALRNIHIDPVHVPVQVDTPDTSKFPHDFPGPSGRQPQFYGEAPEEGFASGTPDLGFKNFGAGRRVVLHGLEAVVPIARAQDFAARHIPALASPSLPSFQPLPTNIVPARLTSDSQQSAIVSLLSRAQVSTSTQSQQNVSAINVTIHATDARSFEQLIRTKGAKVVVEQIVLGKEGLKELLKGAGL